MLSLSMALCNVCVCVYEYATGHMKMPFDVGHVLHRHLAIKENICACCPKHAPYSTTLHRKHTRTHTRGHAVMWNESKLLRCFSSSSFLFFLGVITGFWPLVSNTHFHTLLSLWMCALLLRFHNFVVFFPVYVSVLLFSALFSFSSKCFKSPTRMHSIHIICSGGGCHWFDCIRTRQTRDQIKIPSNNSPPHYQISIRFVVTKRPIATLHEWMDP